MANLAELVAHSARRVPGHLAIVDGQRRTTYAGLDAAIDAFASGLAAVGISAGDRVGILLGNRTEFVVAFFGIVRRGAIAVPLNTSLAADEIRHALEETSPRLLLIDADVRPVVAQAAPDGLLVMVAGSTQWADLVAMGRQQPSPGAAQDPEALAVLLFTAGSTGRPRAAMLTHRALLANTAELMALSQPPAIVPDDVVLGVLPLFHVFALNSVLVATMAGGATLVLQQRFSSRGTLELVKEAGVTVIAAVPPIYIAWSAEPDLRDMLAGVRLMISGAAPLPAAVFDQYTTIAGTAIWEGYGLTECSPVVTSSMVSGRPKAGSVGRPLPGIEMMLVDRGGDPVEDGTGEIYLRSASLFSGYWPDGSGGPDDEGWFATGDVAVIDADGDLRLVDRTKELILVSGFNVYPREVERVLEEIDGVAEAAVVGVPHPYSGEAVKAFISPRPGHQVEAGEVLAHCEQRLARFKCPTILEVVAEIPHTAIGKVARGRLRGQAQA